MKECKRCLLREAAEEDLLADILERIGKLPARDRADDEAYARRLEICCGCDHLISGVCMKCGCYVEFRAAFARQKCPGKKW